MNPFTDALRKTGLRRGKAELEQLDMMADELAAIIGQCVSDSLKNLYFISKSLGTVFAGELTKRMDDRVTRNFFLTPVDATAPYMLEGGYTAVTGSMDGSFSGGNIAG